MEEKISRGFFSSEGGFSAEATTVGEKLTSISLRSGDPKYDNVSMHILSKEAWVEFVKFVRELDDDLVQKEG